MLCRRLGLLHMTRVMQGALCSCSAWEQRKENQPKLGSSEGEGGRKVFCVVWDSWCHIMMSAQLASSRPTPSESLLNLLQLC